MKPGRNDPCLCGSGKKFKKCCSDQHQNSIAGLNTLRPGSLPTTVAVNRRSPQSNDAEAHYDVGNSMIALGQYESAATCYRLALKLKPDFVEAHYNLGNALKDSGQLETAAASFRHALALRPDLVDAHYNLGNIFKDLGKFQDAVNCYRQALALQPGDFDALNNLGISRQNLFSFEDAMASYHKALAIKPDFAEAHNNLGNAYRDIGQIDQAIACYQRALQLRQDYFEAHSNLLFALNYSTSHTPSFNLEQASDFGRIASKKSALRFTSWHSPGQPEKLRVGLVSGDLRNHVVGYFLEAVLAHINPARVELIAYSTQHKEDELTARIRPYFSLWKSLSGKSDDDAARTIHADGVHVLLDISGHTAYNRLPVFSRKPAPVQASWLGYFATTGLAEMDYFLADETGLPETLRDQFTEAAWILPDTRLCFTAPDVDIPATPLPALSNGAITFGCFQNLTKVNDEVLTVWEKIFAALPNARLRMQCKQLAEQAQVEKLFQRLQQHGIRPAQVELQSASSRENYLAAHCEVDLILDTFPFPGGTTTCEALWMGVPTLTLAGESLLARQGASLLSAAGLPEWVATGKSDYISKAAALASDLPKLSMLRAGLRRQVLASPLFDAPRFARNFEEALRGMWEMRNLNK